MYIHQSRQNTQSSTNSWQSSRSNGSQESRSSNATSFDDDIDKAYYSEQATPLALHKTPKHIRYDDGISVSVCSFDSQESEEPCYFDEPQEYHSYQPTYEPTYASSNSFEVIPTSPEDYPNYFPTHNRLNIQHDNSRDGNMNLIVTTEVPEGGRKVNKQLFHLRMHDLTARHFSVRRYCRESGREVCTSTVKKASAVGQRPTIGRSVSSALSALRRTNSGGSHKSDKSIKCNASNVKIIRQDSGYETESSAIESDIEDEEEEDVSDSSAQVKGPSNNLKLEFSNYAQVELTRKGDKKSKHWDFEYWGIHYTWKRKVDHDSVLGKQFSYHLIRIDTQQEAARIMPSLRTAEEQKEEELMGGWIPPCTMWIHDEEILKAQADVAEAVVAAGLITLTDDCVRRLEKKRDAAKKPLSRGVSIRVGKDERLNIELMGPKALIRAMSSKSKKHDKESSRPDTPKRTGTKMATSPLKHHVPAY